MNISKVVPEGCSPTFWNDFKYQIIKLAKPNNLFRNEQETYERILFIFCRKEKLDLFAKNF